MLVDILWQVHSHQLLYPRPINTCMWYNMSIHVVGLNNCSF